MARTSVEMRISWLPTRISWQSLSTSTVPVLFSAIVGANVVTMSLLNFFEADAGALLPTYLASAGAVIALTLKSGIRIPEIRARDHAFSLSLAAIIFLPRCIYLLEGLLGYSVNAVSGDDWFHIQYVASLTNTRSFPPISTFDDSKFLSYYYAPWMLAAMLYHTGWFSTVKQVLGTADLLYTMFLCYFLVYASKALFEESIRRKVFLTVCVLYGGFDFISWASGLDPMPSHSEWWPQEFGLHLQFSNFITLGLWVPQHMLAVAAILGGLYVLTTSSSASSQIVAGLAFLSGAFSSPFVVMGALPLGIFLVFKKRLLKAAPTVLAVFALLSIPLWWIFLEKDSEGFNVALTAFGAFSEPSWAQRKRAAFVVFLVVLLLEFWPLLLASRSTLKGSRDSRWLLAGSLGFLLSTFFVYYIGDNYCMRGAIVPIFTLIYLATPGFESWLRPLRYGWLHVVLLLYFLGGLLEYASFWAETARRTRESDTLFNAQALVSNSSASAIVDPELVEHAGEYRMGWYLLEKSKAQKKNPILLPDAVTMHGDNRYRVTFSSIARGLRYSRAAARVKHSNP